MLERRVSEASLRGLLERPGVLTGFVDGLWLQLQSLYLPYPARPIDPVPSHPQLSAEELAKVPKSKAYRAKFREYEKALARVRKVQAKRANRQVAHAVKMGKVLGQMAWHARTAEVGYVLDARWKLGVRDFAALADAMGSDPAGTSDGSEYQQEARAEERRWKLEDELRELRMREIEAHLAGKRAN
jgi:hypothetical protein